jgi:hypothetical protein
MSFKLHIAQKRVPLRATNFDLDFDKNLGTFTAYLDFSIDALNVAAEKLYGKSIINQVMDYPYVLSRVDLLYKLLNGNTKLWLHDSEEPSMRRLVDFILSSFKEVYEPGTNTGDFEVSKNSKWKVWSLSYTGVELDGPASSYDTNFNNGLVKIKVHGRFSLKEL